MTFNAGFLNMDLFYEVYTWMLLFKAGLNASERNILTAVV